VLVGHNDALHVERELFAVEISAQLTRLHRKASRLRQHRSQTRLSGHQEVSLGPRAVVELGTGSKENAASGLPGVVDPSHPILEHLAQARDAARRLQGRTNHLVREPVGGGLQHRDLEIFLRPEMCEQPALG
jgi:hypothetical protein